MKARLLSAKFRNRQFSGLLLDQAFLAGLGNYLRVEILWQVGLTGGHKASKLNETQNYFPQEYDKIKKGSVMQKGNYVCMIVSDNFDKIKEIYESAFE